MVKHGNGLTNGIHCIAFYQSHAEPTEKDRDCYMPEQNMACILRYDDGANWKSFQLNLPVVPITDLTIKE